MKFERQKIVLSPLQNRQLRRHQDFQPKLKQFTWRLVYNPKPDSLTLRTSLETKPFAAAGTSELNELQYNENLPTLGVTSLLKASIFDDAFLF
jgi:hypothetical protein